MTDNLACNTPAGRIAIQNQDRATDILRKAFPDLMFAKLKDTGRSVIDVVSMRDMVITSGMEIKSRNLTRDQLKKYNDEWLVTFDKVLDGMLVAYKMNMPFYGVLFLVPENKILVQQISDEDGNATCNLLVGNTPTQETCNGGKIYRANAYIDMTNAKEYS